MSKFNEAQRDAVFAAYTEVRSTATNAEALEHLVDKYPFITSVNSARGLLTSKLAGGIYQPDVKAVTKSGVKRVTRQEIVNEINDATGITLDSLVKANMADLKALRDFVAK